MNKIEASKFADTLISEFVSDNGYINRDKMHNDLIEVFCKYGTKMDEYEYFNINDLILDILIINKLNFGGSSDSHFDDRLYVLLHTKFDTKITCITCSKFSPKYQMYSCDKCKKYYCDSYGKCGKNIRILKNLKSYCKSCLEKISE